MNRSCKRAVVAGLARRCGGEVRVGRSGVAPRGARYLGVAAPTNAAADDIAAAGAAAGLGAACAACAADLGPVVWWTGTRL